MWFNTTMDLSVYDFSFLWGPPQGPWTVGLSPQMDVYHLEDFVCFDYQRDEAIVGFIRAEDTRVRLRAVTTNKPRLEFVLGYADFEPGESASCLKTSAGEFKLTRTISCLGNEGMVTCRMRLKIPMEALDCVIKMSHALGK